MGYKLFRTQRAVYRCLEEALAPYGITPVQYNSLNQLERRGPLSQRQLAAAVHREPATITRSIDKMEAAGLVQRQPDPRDRRANVITVTAQGSALLSSLQATVDEGNRRVESGLSAEEVARLSAALDLIYANCTDSESAE